MTLFYKLYQPWSRCFKLHKNVYFLSKHICTKLISLDDLITKNPDIYKKMTENLPTTEWKDIREKILQKNLQVTPNIVDCTIIDMCLMNSQVDKAIAYFKFLRENNYPLNLAVIGKYLKLYVMKQHSLTDEDKTEIVETYNALRQKHPYLDSWTAEQCIITLCLTDEWEKTHEIIEMMKITSNPGTTVYSALASAAFRNGKPDVAWKALTDIVLRGLVPQNVVYMSYLQYCLLKNTNTFNSNLEKMFNFWSEHSIIPNNKLISTYVHAVRQYGWSTQLVTICKKTFVASLF